VAYFVIDAAVNRQTMQMTEWWVERARRSGTAR